MTDTRRIQRLLSASPTMLAKIDKVLNGEDASPSSEEADVRTLTLTEAARRLGVSRPTVYRLVRAGRLRTVPLFGVSRVVLSSVIEFVQEVRA